MDADGPGWVSQTQALEQEGQLRNAPVEYLEALPWVTRGGQRWIHQDTLREWCGGGVVFADRAAGGAARSGGSRLARSAGTVTEVGREPEAAWGGDHPPGAAPAWGSVTILG